MHTSHVIVKETVSFSAEIPMLTFPHEQQQAEVFKPGSTHLCCLSKRTKEEEIHTEKTGIRNR